MTERFTNHSGMIPEPFRTSRARADQGTREHGAGVRDGEVGHPCSNPRAAYPTLWITPGMDARSARRWGGR